MQFGTSPVFLPVKISTLCKISATSTAFSTTVKKFIKENFPEEYERHERYNDWTKCKITRSQIYRWSGNRKHVSTAKPSSYYEQKSEYMVYLNNLVRQNLTHVTTELSKTQGDRGDRRLGNYHRMDYPCAKCDARLHTLEKLEAHMDETHDGARYFCDLCDGQIVTLGVIILL